MSQMDSETQSYQDELSRRHAARELELVAAYKKDFDDDDDADDDARLDPTTGHYIIRHKCECGEVMLVEDEYLTDCADRGTKLVCDDCWKKLQKEKQRAEEENARVRRQLGF